MTLEFFANNMLHSTQHISKGPLMKIVYNSPEKSMANVKNSLVLN